MRVQVWLSDEKGDVLVYAPKSRWKIVWLFFEPAPRTLVVWDTSRYVEVFQAPWSISSMSDVSWLTLFSKTGARYQ